MKPTCMTTVVLSPLPLLLRLINHQTNAKIVSGVCYRPQTKFTKVMFYRCLSVYRGVPGVWGGMPGPGGYAARGCLVHGGVPGPGGGVPGPWVGGVPDPGREGAWLGGCGAPPLDDYCFGQYASYWNAFLLFSLLIFFAARKRNV